jgi:hypothetical protein
MTSLWISDPMVLIDEASGLHDFYPNKTNTFKQNINAIARLIIVFGIVLTLFTMNSAFLTESLKYLVLLGVVSFVYISAPPKIEEQVEDEEKFGNRQRFVDSGGIDGGIGSPNKWGGADYKEKFTPEPRMSLIGSPSFDERNVDLRKLAYFDKNLMNVRSTTAGFPSQRYI